MEEVLEMILTEIKGVKEEVKEEKEEVKEVRIEVKDIRTDLEKTKIELREEMQEMKKEIYREMDYRFDKQSKEIAEELRNLTVYFEAKNREIVEANIEINKEILKELKRNRMEHKIFNARLDNIELAQANLEEILQRVGWYIFIYQLFKLYRKVYTKLKKCGKIEYIGKL